MQSAIRHAQRRRQHSRSLASVPPSHIIREFKVKKELEGKARIKKPRDKDFYKRKSSIHRNQYHNSLDRNAHRINAPNFSINDIHYQTRQQGKGRIDRDNKAALFQSWYETQRAFGDYMPSWDEMRYNVNIRLKFCEHIETYLHHVHRATFNTGDSLQPSTKLI